MIEYIFIFLFSKACVRMLLVGWSTWNQRIVFTETWPREIVLFPIQIVLKYQTLACPGNEDVNDNMLLQ